MDLQHHPVSYSHCGCCGWELKMTTTLQPSRSYNLVMASGPHMMTLLQHSSLKYNIACRIRKPRPLQQSSMSRIKILNKPQHLESFSDDFVSAEIYVMSKKSSSVRKCYLVCSGKGTTVTQREEGPFQKYNRILS